MALSAEKILKHAGNPNTREVHIPEWADESGDDTVIVRGLTIREWEIHQGRLAKAAADDKQGYANAQLIARCVVDDQGNRVFTDAHARQIADLGLGAVAKLKDAIDDASGLSDESEDEARGESDTAETNS